ncbi:YihY family inner membrane protein [Rhodoferax sp. UBA5149]|uniref:YihY family inner membrane protein n=1 Tax=Rhodoferax sp. UBA5149 TaxID=1947379 RepID=UPI0025E20E2B|nr:YihY family inner membrane protein [Rhodoferax sp. UBA5149]
MSLLVPPPLSLSLRLEALLKSLSHFPWKSTAQTLRERFREDRLGLTASSLTFTTTIALVPFITVALAVFTAFPMFAKFQGVLQKWLVESLIPDNIARQVLGYLTQFAGQASKLGVAGVAVLFSSALALILTIDRTLNGIWRVRQPRPFGQRVLVYWAAITLGPLLLGISLTITSYAISASKGVVGVMPGGVQLLLDALQFFLMAGGMAAMYHYVPNIQVKWGHAWTGGLFVSVGFEVAKRLLTLYLSKVPTYSVVYGAFATVPILLIWIYVAWVIVLLGAVITAYLPSLLAGLERRARSHGLQFQLALEALQQLDRVRATVGKGWTMAQLSLLLRVDTLQLEPVLETLCELDWVGLLHEELADEAARYVLLADPDTTPLAPLLNALLLRREESTQNLWENGRWPSLILREAL